MLSLFYYIRQGAEKLPKVLLFTLLTAAGAHAFEAGHTVRISLTYYPPILDKDGSIGTDLVSAAFDTQGIKTEYHHYPMPRVFWAVDKDELDLVLGSRDWLKNSPHETQYYPIVIYRPGFYFFGLKDNYPDGIHFDKLEDFQDKEILYIKGGALTPLLQKAQIKPHLVTHLEQSPYIVKTGHSDMFAALGIAAWNAIEQAYPGESSQFIQSNKVIYTISGDVLFPEKSRHLMQVFNKGLDEIITNGTYLKILKQYYQGRDIPAEAIISAP